MKQDRITKKAFTLLEVLVSLVGVSIIVTLSMYMIKVSTHSLQYTEHEYSSRAASMECMTYITREIQSAKSIEITNENKKMCVEDADGNRITYEIVANRFGGELRQYTNEPDKYNGLINVDYDTSGFYPPDSDIKVCMSPDTFNGTYINNYEQIWDINAEYSDKVSLIFDYIDLGYGDTIKVTGENSGSVYAELTYENNSTEQLTVNCTDDGKVRIWFETDNTDVGTGFKVSSVKAVQNEQSVNKYITINLNNMDSIDGESSDNHSISMGICTRNNDVHIVTD